MPDRHDEPTAKEQDDRETTNKSLSRRRLIQIGGTGLAIGALGTVGASALDTDLSNSIVIDGTVSSETAAYEFLTSGDVALHPDLGSNTDSTNLNSGHVTGTVGNETHAYQFNGTLSYLDVDGNAEITLLYGDSGATNTDRLEIVAASDGSVDYQITSSDTVEKVTDNGDRSANDGEDTVTENNDGTWTVTGSTANGSGDTYDFHGSIDHFEPVTGDFTLFFNGEETTVTELTGQKVDDGETTVDREHWYSFEATGDQYADYYIEVEDGGNMIPSTVDDAVIENDFHWINDDGTKAAGRIDPGETHAYAFDTLVADVTIDGEADATVNGSPSDLSNYPQDTASGDHWKGYFPWHIEGETRDHWYSFEATGDQYVDYYIEVEDGGDIIPSLENDAIVEYEFFWIGDNGTKAAGRVDPGETHAYAFDTLVADVTVEGGAVQPLVNGAESNLGIYPQDTASGDHWKGGFPWQDDDQQVTSDTDVGIRHDLYDGPLGGGDGMSSSAVYSASDADIVVNDGNVDGALSGASSGDVIYVDGSASGFTADVSNVTIAGNRGIGSDGEITGKVDVVADDVRLDGLKISPGSGTALSIDAQNLVTYNCAIVNGSNKVVRFERKNTAARFTQCKFAHYDGYGVSLNHYEHDEAHKVVFEYNEFTDLGRHGLILGSAWAAVRDNHTYGNMTELSTDHWISFRAPNEYGINGGSAPVECGAPCGNGVIEHNLHEITGTDGKSRLAVVRGEPTDGVWVQDNEAPGNTAPTGGCHSNGTHGGWGEQLVMQNASSTNDFSNVFIENNQR
ncbi:hypothetical protein HWV23_15835 [Natronomonas halophila]|uniref:hypothetical protein n=1 Tax=Natronomonas halophila TaxID=2747817 RepID=UPI0015B6FCC2|nr:hypothetical protein [Natronomonas halophila]QLD87131.1 hypothetical protein HWV23_15835 [Natronomonas halophila]